MLVPDIDMPAVLTEGQDGNPQHAVLQVEIKALAIALFAVTIEMLLEIFS